MQMLFNTSLVAHVGSGDGAGTSQRCLQVLNTKRDKEIIRMNYNTRVLSVRINRQRLVVALESTIYVYDTTNMHLVHVVGPTPPNPRGASVPAVASLPARGSLRRTARRASLPARPASAGLRMVPPCPPAVPAPDCASVSLPVSCC